MDPHRNDIFKHSGPKFNNTLDAFGNKLAIGDEVYYACYNINGKGYIIKKGKVTHFTKWKIGVDGIPRDFDKLGKVIGK